MQNSSLISPESASKVTLVSVSGLPDATGAGMALVLSQMHMPGCRAVLCSPVRPAGLPASVEHVEIAPLSYIEYSWFMMFVLWHVVHTEFALIVQDDGWVLDGSLWRDEYLEYDYIGASTHLAKVRSPDGGEYWSPYFQWAQNLPEGHVATPVLNGGFCLRSRRLMRVFIDHPEVQMVIPAPDYLMKEPLKMRWVNDAPNEDVQLTGVLRPQLEALGFRFASLELASSFAIEQAGAFHLGQNALAIFGHHAKLRPLVKLDPLTVRYPISKSQVSQIFGEAELARMLELRGYQLEYAPEADALNASAGEPRRVYDCFTYNGEFEILLVRLHELAEVVDCFVIVEATRTFAGAKKSLRLDMNAPELAAFKDRIRYIVIDGMPDDPPGSEHAVVERDWLNNPPKTGFWLREKFQRNQILRALDDAAPTDLVLISDADEIPRASVVTWMREQSPDQVFGLQLQFYYFYANYCNVDGGESHSIWSVAGSRKCFDGMTPDLLRMGVRLGQVPATILRDAGWHFSYMGMNEEQVRQKIRGFAHQEYNDAGFLDAIDLGAVVRSGKDLFGRPGYVWALTDGQDIPVWFREQESLRHLFFQTESTAISHD